MNRRRQDARAAWLMLTPFLLFFALFVVYPLAMTIYYSFTTFYNVSEEEVGDYIKSYRKRYKEKGIYECKLYDGMEQTLRALKKGGVKLGIASSKPLHLIYDVMRVVGIGDLFDAVVGTQLDDSRHEGKPRKARHQRQDARAHGRRPLFRYRRGGRCGCGQCRHAVRLRITRGI